MSHVSQDALAGSPRNRPHRPRRSGPGSPGESHTLAEIAQEYARHLRQWARRVVLAALHSGHRA